MSKFPALNHSQEMAASPAVHTQLAQEKPSITPLRIGYLTLAIAVLVYTGYRSDLSFVELFQNSRTIWLVTSLDIFLLTSLAGGLTCRKP